jgi:hypothetical protein
VVEYGDRTGTMTKTDTGYFVGGELVDSGLSGQTPQQLGVKPVAGPRADALKAGEDMTAQAKAAPGTPQAPATDLDQQAADLVAEMEDLFGVDMANTMIDAALKQLGGGKNFQQQIEAIKNEFNRQLEEATAGSSQQTGQPDTAGGAGQGQAVAGEDVQNAVGAAAEEFAGRRAEDSDYVTALVEDLELSEQQLAEIKGVNLFSNLGGLRLTREDWNEISGKYKKRKGGSKAGQWPTFAMGGENAVSLSDRVADGDFDAYLPYDMQTTSTRFDEQESTEFIKEALSGWEPGAVYYPVDVRMALDQANAAVDNLEKQLREEYELDEINKEIQRISAELAQEAGAINAEQTSPTGDVVEGEGADAEAEVTPVAEPAPAAKPVAEPETKTASDKPAPAAEPPKKLPTAPAVRKQMEKKAAEAEQSATPKTQAQFDIRLSGILRGQRSKAGGVIQAEKFILENGAALKDFVPESARKSPAALKEWLEKKATAARVGIADEQAAEKKAVDRDFAEARAEAAVEKVKEQAIAASRAMDAEIEKMDGKMEKYDQEAKTYGYSVDASGAITKGDKKLSPVVKEVKGRLRVESPDGNLLFSGEQSGKAFGKFLQSFWGAEKVKTPTAPAVQKQMAKREAEAEPLTTQTKAEIEAKQDQEANAPQAQQREQIRKESEIGDSAFMTGFDGDARQDSTGNLFETTSSYVTREITNAFGSGPADVESANNAATALTPFIEAIPVVTKDLPVGTLARYNRTSGEIEISSTYPFTQDRLVEALMEERLHALDSITPRRTMSGESDLFKAGGEVYEAAMREHKNMGVFGEFLAYPMDNANDYSPERMAAELFARIGVLFSTDPVMAGAKFPALKDVYDVRPASTFSIDERLSDQIPSFERDFGPASQNRSQQRQGPLADAVLGKLGTARQPADPARVARSRQRVSEALKQAEQSAAKRGATGERFSKTTAEPTGNTVSAINQSLKDEGLDKNNIKVVQSLSESDAKGLEDGRLSQIVYHGTPHRGIVKFTTDKMGTGEGAQAYGWGLYFADKKDVAEFYRKTLSNDFAKKLVENEAESAGSRDPAVIWARIKDYFAQSPSAAKRAPSLDSEDRVRIVLERKSGQLYEVSIPDDTEMLLWDKPLSEQSEAVKKALSDNTPLGGTKKPWAMTGSQMYQSMTRGAVGFPGIDSDKAASQYLASLGIKGIKFLDGTSRSAGEGSFNYVIFDGADTEITNTFYSRGDGQIQGFYNPKTNEITLVADGIPKGRETGVALHEIFHRGESNLTPEQNKALTDQVNRWKNRNEGTNERKIYEAATARAEASGDAKGEFLAYAIEEARNLGVQPNAKKGTITAEGWLAKVKQFFTAALEKLAPTYKGDLDATDLVDIAYGIAAKDAEVQQANPQNFKNAGSKVSGLVVRDEIPNEDSIDSTLDDYEVLDGVKEVPLNLFTLTGKSYSQSETKRIENLANQIKQSGEIAPLIVVQDNEGYYILEGGHRSEALYLLGKETMPALVVVDRSEDSGVRDSDIRYSRQPLTIKQMEEAIKNKSLPKEPRMTLQEFDDVMATNLVDSTRPHDVWARGQDPELASKLVRQKNLATGRIALFEKEAMMLHGKAIANDIGAIAKKAGIDWELAKQLAGDWMSARYAPEANAYLMKQDQQAFAQAIDEVTELSDEVNYFNQLSKDVSKAIASGTPTMKTLDALLVRSRDVARAEKRLKKVQELNPKTPEGEVEKQTQIAYLENMLDEAEADFKEMRADIASGKGNDAIARNLLKKVAVRLSSLRSEMGKKSSEMNKAKDKMLKRAAAVAGPVTDLTDKALAPRLEAGVAGGYTNKTAEKVRSMAEDVIDKKDLETLADKVYAMNQWKLEQDLKSGKATQAMVDTWPKSDRYVPLTGDPRSDQSESSDLFATGSVNQAADKSMQGRTQSRAQDGITASFEQVDKSAKYYGWKPYKESLHSWYEQTFKDFVAQGLPPVDEQKARAELKKEGKTPKEIQARIEVMTRQHAAEQIRKLYGISRSRETMQRQSDNLIIYRKGKDNWVYDMGDQEAVAALKSSYIDPLTGASKVAGTMTRFIARNVVQLLPGQAINSFIRDVWEKSENIRTRSQELGFDMNQVGRDLAKKSLDPRTVKAIGQVVAQGTSLENAIKIDENDPIVRQVKEFLSTGGGSTWGESVSAGAEQLNEKLQDQLTLANSQGGWGMTKAAARNTADMLGVWNQSFELKTAFASYQALTENGVPKEAAADIALELMNYRKRGKIMAAPNAWYMFAQTIATGGQQLYKTLRTPRGRTRLMVQAGISYALYSLIRSMFEDEETGENMLDNSSDTMLERTIPIPIPGTDDGVFKLPVGFGAPQLAWGLGVNMARATQGQQTAAETIGNITKLFVKSMVPVAPSEASITNDFFTWFLQTISPTIVDPTTNVGLNKSAFGGNLASVTQRDKPEALQGKRNTAEEYKATAEWAAKTLGVDMAPEKYRELGWGYLAGPMKEFVIKPLIDNPNKEKMAQIMAEAGGKPATVYSTMVDRWLTSINDDTIKQRLFYKARDEMIEANKKKELGREMTPREKKLDTLYDKVKREEGRARQIVSQAAKSKSDSQKESARVQFAKAMIKVERDTLKEMKNMRGMD